MAGVKPIKDTQVLAKKFGDRAFAAGPEYKAGVLANTNQNAAAQAAGDRWLAGVNAAGVPKLEKGLRRAGQEKFVRNASTKGAERFPSGAKAAAPDWATGMDPILTALKSLTLTPKGLRRSPQNITRVNEVITAIEKAADARP